MPQEELFHDSEDVLVGDDEVVGTLVLDLGAAVAGVDDLLADLDLDLVALTDGDDHALLRAFSGRVVRQDDAGRRLLLRLLRSDEDVDAQRFDWQCFHRVHITAYYIVQYISKVSTSQE